MLEDERAARQAAARRAQGKDSGSGSLRPARSVSVASLPDQRARLKSTCVMTHNFREQSALCMCHSLRNCSARH